jgi:glycosyltransferase involved in cell wall biosynthesis
VSGPRKIVLIGNFLPDRQESMQRFARVLADGFTKQGLPVETWQPDRFFVKLVSSYRYGGLPKYLGYLDKFFRFPRQLRARQRAQPAGTVYHIVDHGNAVYAPHFHGRPLLVTVHDLLQIRSALGEFPQNRISKTGRRYQQWILDKLKRAPLAACISHKTQEDLLRLTGLPAERTAVVLNGLNYPYRPMEAALARDTFDKMLSRHNLAVPAEAGLRSGPTVTPRFFVGIGGAQWYKNRSGLISIFGELQARLPDKPPLLYVGPPFDPEQEALVSSYNLRDAVLRIPHVENEELRALYSLAQGLIFPSWEEGFGWPIAEAQACGCPVFTTNRAPMTEVGGEAAGYIDPADPAGAAEIIADALSRAPEMRAAGLRAASRWELQPMLDGYLDLYTRLLSRVPSSAIHLAV